MLQVIWDWLLDLPQQFNLFGNWLITPLQYINIAPLYLVGFGGLTTIIALLVVRLVIGG